MNEDDELRHEFAAWVAEAERKAQDNDSFGKFALRALAIVKLMQDGVELRAIKKPN